MQPTIVGIISLSLVFENLIYQSFLSRVLLISFQEWKSRRFVYLKDGGQQEQPQGLFYMIKKKDVIDGNFL